MRGPRGRGQRGAAAWGAGGHGGWEVGAETPNPGRNGELEKKKKKTQHAGTGAAFNTFSQTVRPLPSSNLYSSAHSVGQVLWLPCGEWGNQGSEWSSHRWLTELEGTEMQASKSLLQMLPLTITAGRSIRDLLLLCFPNLAQRTPPLRSPPEFLPLLGRDMHFLYFNKTTPCFVCIFIAALSTSYYDHIFSNLCLPQGRSNAGNMFQPQHLAWHRVGAQ